MLVLVRKANQGIVFTLGKVKITIKVIEIDRDKDSVKLSITAFPGEGATLVLTKKPDQWIVMTIDGVEIRLKVIKIEGSQVKVGIEAPLEVKILRAELVRSKGQ